MNHTRKAIRFGWTILMLSLLLRLYATGAVDRFLARLAEPDTAAFLLYTQTGRDARSVSVYLEEPQAVFTPAYPAESPPPDIPETPRVFTREMAETISITDFAGRSPDLGTLLTRELPWQTRPGVLILHTHTTESYTKSGEDYRETSAYRTDDPAYNMLHIGDILTENLEKSGITVYHATAVHDSPAYNGAYTRSRKTVRQALREHPDISLVLDVHRDAVETASGQLRTQSPEGTAQIMLVMGSDASGLSNPNWEENLSLALKLQVILEDLSPGITRPIQLRAQRFNQDLSPGAMLVEIGAAGNTRHDAEQAAEILARALTELVEPVG